MKQCNTCKIEKPHKDFYKSKIRIDGYNYECKDCHKAYLKRKSNDIEFKRKNNNRSSNWRKKYKAKNKKSIYEAAIKRKGLSLDDYTLLLISQNHCCAICNTPEYNLKKRLFIDHCHSTGKIRGLLCANCNSAIGFAKDNTDVLNNCIKYLMENKND